MGSTENMTPSGVPWVRQQIEYHRANCDPGDECQLCLRCETCGLTQGDNPEYRED